jgi:hypothetical protein
LPYPETEHSGNEAHTITQLLVGLHAPNVSNLVGGLQTVHCAKLRTGTKCAVYYNVQVSLRNHSIFVDAYGEITFVSCPHVKYAEPIRNFIHLSSEFSFLISTYSVTYNDSRKHADVSTDWLRTTALYKADLFPRIL